MAEFIDELTRIVASLEARQAASETPEAAEVRAELERRDGELSARREVLGRCANLVSRGIPAKDVEAIAADQLEDTQAMGVARRFAENGKRMLVLSGPRGCGKTVAAGWLIGQNVTPPRDYAAELAATPQSAREERGGFVPAGGSRRRHAPPLFLDVSALVRHSRYRSEDMAPLEQALVLAIDDLGMEYGDEKGSFLATLDGLINTRYAARLYTVITTNLPMAEFRRRYGERIADRFREVGAFVELNGASLRGRR